ncbi:hypothetical protein Tco_0654273 [Tanacetum coccineum]|uniref:Uncharacterized protein n=1 Tax=Tanacetum coccineum TaxID=301880 RepID=A0ABQ4X2Q5_9ASTR
MRSYHHSVTMFSSIRFDSCFLLTDYHIKAEVIMTSHYIALAYAWFTYPRPAKTKKRLQPYCVGHLFIQIYTCKSEPLSLATSPFLSSTDDSSDSDIPDTPPLFTHGTPFTETILSTQRSPVASGPDEEVGPLPTHRLIVRHSVDYSSSDHFSSDDSSRDSSSSSHQTHSFLGFFCNVYLISCNLIIHYHIMRRYADLASSVGSLVPIIHRSSAAIFERPSHSSSPVSPSRKRSRSPAAYIRSPKTTTDLKGCSEDSFEPYIPREADWELVLRMRVLSRLADALRTRGIDARVLVEAVDQEEVCVGIHREVPSILGSTKTKCRKSTLIFSLTLNPYLKLRPKL